MRIGRLLALCLPLWLIAGVVRAEPRGPAVRVNWTHASKRHALQTHWDASLGSLVLTSRSEGDDREFDAYEERLLSVVGPMVSVHTTHDSMLADSAHASRTDRLEVRFVTQYRFDLEAYLKESKQSGEVVWQWLAQQPEDAIVRERCPAEDEMRWADRSLGFWAATLRASGCTPEGHALEHVGTAPKQFSIVSWEPAVKRVTLRIEASTVRIQSTAHELTTFTAAVVPPPEWIPWLDAARAGNGLLESHIAAEAVGITGAHDRDAFGRLLFGHRRAERLIVGRLTGGLSVHRAGVDDQLLGQACFEEIERLRGDSTSVEYPDATCAPLDVVSPGRLTAAGLDETASSRELRQAFPEFSRRGSLYLLAPMDPVERAFWADAIALSPGAVERLRHVVSP